VLISGNDFTHHHRITTVKAVALTNSPYQTHHNIFQAPSQPNDTMIEEDYSWLDPVLRPQALINMEAVSDVKITSSYPDPTSMLQTVVDMEPANEVKKTFSYPDPVLITQAPVNMESASEVNEVKVPVPDYSQVVDLSKLSEMWVVSQDPSMSASLTLTHPQAWQNPDLNIVGAMNGCQSKFDETTFWDRDNKNGYHCHQILDPQACSVARLNSINNITANNKMYADMLDYQAEQQKAFDALYAYNSTKFSKETIHGKYRQKAAQRGAANRRAGVKRHEEMVMGIVEELVALRDYRNVLDGRYKQRFDRLAKEVVAVAKVKMTAEMNAKLAYGAGPGVQG
jgi:hypothetical protein